MRTIENQHKVLKQAYDLGQSPINQLKAISVYCIRLLNTQTVIEYGTTNGKTYFSYSNGEFISRPLVKGLYINTTRDFENGWDNFLKSIVPAQQISTMAPRDIDRVLYTAIMSFSCCYDLWKNKSRKTPGTHFEVLLGSILSEFLPSFVRQKFITLPNQDEKVSTDIVFANENGGIVIPAKITTRERIVQPYAHQRILDSIFTDGRYRSILMCVSETQRDDKHISVNEICVPGTVKLFQAHLSSMSGIYYLDPPSRYLAEDIARLVKVGSYGELLCSDLRQLASPILKA